jgi:hypothetical protein
MRNTYNESNPFKYLGLLVDKDSSIEEDIKSENCDGK